MSQCQRLNNCIKLRGDLLFSSIVEVRAELEAELQGPGETLQIDFADVGQVDSSALSLWLCLMRRAEQARIRLEAINVPEQLRSMAHLAGLNALVLDQ